MYDSLLFIKIQELRDICTALKINHTGTKLMMIDRICVYKDGNQLPEEKAIPEISKCHGNRKSYLSPDSLVLKGAYKSDLKTRNFLKTLCGEDFHFTAQMLDWIQEMWIAGAPPTYQKLADFYLDKIPYVPSKALHYNNFRKSGKSQAEWNIARNEAKENVMRWLRL